MKLLKSNAIVPLSLLAQAIATNQALQRASSLPKIGVMASQRLTIDGNAYAFDGEAFHRNVEVLSKLVLSNRKERDLVVADIRKLEPIIAPVFDDTERAVRGRPAMMSMSPEVFWGSNDWPVAKVMPGVVAVIGEMFAGKTYHILNTMETIALVRYGEPFEHIDLERGVIHVHTFEEAVTVATVLSFCGLSTAVDSLRPLVFGLKGNATEGGVSGDLYSLMTELNNFCVNLGVTVVFAVNPMSGNSEKTAGLYQKIGASCAGAVHLASKIVVGQTFRLEDGRTSGGSPEPDERPARSDQELTRLVWGAETTLDQPGSRIISDPDIGISNAALGNTEVQRSFPVTEIN